MVDTKRTVKLKWTMIVWRIEGRVVELERLPVWSLAYIYSQGLSEATALPRRHRWQPPCKHQSVALRGSVQYCAAALPKDPSAKKKIARSHSYEYFPCSSSVDGRSRKDTMRAADVVVDISATFQSSSGFHKIPHVIVFKWPWWVAWLISFWAKNQMIIKLPSWLQSRHHFLFHSTTGNPVAWVDRKRYDFSSDRYKIAML
jgi:hypothetical protein